MQYIGGKQKSGGHKIAAHVARFAGGFKTRVVTEPFCGGLSVTYRLASKHGLKVLASDACEELIVLYLALQNGWEPPAHVTRETWESYRANPIAGDPMTAFVGFGCSYRGQWFGGYVGYSKRTGSKRVDSALAAKESLTRKLAACEGVAFRAASYDELELEGVVYCDIPYADSLGYPAVGPFDHAAFWAWAERVSQVRPVLVSERVAPEPFVVLDEWSLQSRITTKSKTRRVERVFVHPRWLS